MTLNGTFDPYGIFYIPPPDAQGVEEEAAFHAGLERSAALTDLLLRIQSFDRLRVSNNDVTPATSIDMSARSITMFDSNSRPMPVKNFSTTVDCTGIGVNALDESILSSNKWYYFYAIAKTDGTNAGIASLSATTPIMPTGYTYKKLVSAIYYLTTGVSNFRPIHQFDRWVEYDSPFLLYGADSNSWTAKSLSALVPSLSTKIKLQVYGGETYDLYHAIAWDSSGDLHSTNFISKTTGAPWVPAQDAVTQSPCEYLLNPADPQTIYAKGYDDNWRGNGNCLAYELDI